MPRDLQARVLGALGALAYVGIPFGGLIIGSPVTAIGVQGALAAAEFGRLTAGV